MTNYSTLKSTGAPGFPPGFIIPWGHNSIPVGFLLCNGDQVSRTTYAVSYTHLTLPTIYTV